MSTTRPSNEPEGTRAGVPETRRVPGKCAVCQEAGEFLELRAPVLDRYGHPMYPARCLNCGQLSLICPLGNTGEAVVVRLDSCPTDLQDMVRTGVARYGGLTTS
jgi:hypothetical protein